MPSELRRSIHLTASEGWKELSLLLASGFVFLTIEVELTRVDPTRFGTLHLNHLVRLLVDTLGKEGRE